MGKGCFNTTQALVFVIITIASIVVGAMSIGLDDDYDHEQSSTVGWDKFMNDTSPGNRTQTLREQVGPAKIVVGGSEEWRFGFNYTHWAFQNEPFYVNDTLVFKYDPPSKKSFAHSVYLLPNLWSYLKCDFRGAIRVASWTQGSGKGFEFVLKTWKPYYFACGEGHGLHCTAGGMKFMVFPVRRWPHD